MSVLSENIKKRRTELGISQTELAKMLGYSDRSAISKIESGNVDIQNAKVYAFARALRIDPSELCGWNIEDPTPEDRKILELFNSMNAEGQEKALDYVKLLASSGQYKKHNSSVMVEGA